MEGNKPSRYRNTSKRISDDRMSSIDQVLANEGMNQAMVLGNLTLDTFTYVRAWLKAAGQAGTRGVASKSPF
jgi:hypothetical protein